MNWHIVHAKSTCLTFSEKNWQIQLFSTPTLKAYHYADKRAVNLLKTTKNRHFERHHNVAEIHFKKISKLSHIYNLAGVFYNVIYYAKKIRQKISVVKTNTSDDIKKIVHFGILIHVLSWRQQKSVKFLLWLLRFSGEFFDAIIGDQ